MRLSTLFTGLLWCLVLVAPCQAQQIQREDFEANETRLKLGLTDGQIELLDHHLSSEFAHGGRQSEEMRVRILSGEYCFAEYPTPHALVFEELVISAWVLSDRPGTQILARVVLPHFPDPKTNEPATLLLRGDELDVAQRWRRLGIRRPDLALQQQQQLLQASTRSRVDIRDAYVDRILFDVHGGIGDFLVRVDDLQIGPIALGKEFDAKPSMTQAPLGLKGEDGETPRVKVPEIADQAAKNRAEVVADQLRVGGRPFLLRGIRRSDAPLAILREAGFNAIFMEPEYVASTADEVAKLGLFKVVMLPLGTREASTAFLNAPDPWVPVDDRTLGVLVGSQMTAAAESTISSAVDRIRADDAARGRPVLGDVQDGLRRYSRRLDMVSAHRSPLGTSLSLEAYHRWLTERKNLGRPGTLYWTWIQSQPDESLCRLTHGHGYDAPFAVPVGPSSEQMRLLTYSAVAAGYRGIAFTSDRCMSDATHGRDRALELALLNLELTLAEPFLAAAESPITAKTSHPDVAAVVFKIPERGALALAYSRRERSQHCVGQASINDLNLIVEGVPESSQAFQIGTTEVRGLRRELGLGGVRVIIPEFDTVALVVLTPESTLYAHYQELVQQVGDQATRWQLELAELQLARAEEVDARLESIGHPNADARHLLSEARSQLTTARQSMDRRDGRLGASSAIRCRRLVRAAQRTHWDAAVAGLTDPVADPFAVAFQTLPEHYAFVDAIRAAQFGGERLPGGDFELDGHLDALGWKYQPESADEIRHAALLAADQPLEGERALALEVAPRDRRNPPAVVENTQVAMITPPVRARRGQIARISGFVRTPAAVVGSVDGAMVWDSAGGPSLGLRFTHAPAWTPFVLYRPIVEDQDLTVHLVMTGLGTVLFDNIAIELAAPAELPLAGRSPTLTRSPR